MEAVYMALGLGLTAVIVLVIAMAFSPSLARGVGYIAGQLVGWVRRDGAH